MSKSRALKVVFLAAGEPPNGAGVSNLVSNILSLPFETSRQRTRSADVQQRKQPVVFNVNEDDELVGTACVSLIDTAASTQERWHMCAQAGVVVVVYDASDEGSVAAVPSTVQDARGAAGPAAAVIVVAAKIDLPRADDSAKQFATSSVDLFLETSAKTGSVRVLLDDGVLEETVLLDEIIVTGFKRQRCAVAVLAEPTAAKKVVEVAAAPSADAFAPKLVERDLNAAPLHPPVLVPKLRDGSDDIDIAVGASANNRSSDDDNDSTGAAAAAKKSKSSGGASAKMLSALLAKVGDVVADAQDMLALLRKHGIDFKGRVLQTGSSDDDSDSD